MLRMRSFDLFHDFSSLKHCVEETKIQMCQIAFKGASLKKVSLNIFTTTNQTKLNQICVKK